MDLIYPSTDFPPPPAIRLRVPDGWVRADVPEALLAAADPSSPPGFVANLIVTVGRIVGDDDLDAIVQRQRQAAGRDARLEREDREPIAGRDAVWLATSYAPTADRPIPLFQAQATLLVPRRDRVADAVTLIGSCAAASSGHYSPIFRDAFLSLVVDE
jgi:hypothetical protein